MPSKKTKSKTAKEKRQEREREILSRTVEREQALREMEKHVKASSKAIAALDALVRDGCNRKKILWRLYQFCGGSPADADAVKRAFQTRREFLLRLSERLTRVALDLETAKSYLSDIELDIVYPQNFTEQIPSLAASLKDLANRVVKLYSWQRTSGRDHHLVALATMIEARARREHYKELADLIDAIRLGYDPTCEKMETADTLRNLVDRNRPLDLAFSPKNDAATRQRKPQISKHRTARPKGQ
jgi:hypothetical protein